MRTVHRQRAFPLIALVALATTGFGQAPTARLQVSTSSGFLGIGSPRFVSMRLSTPGRDTVLTSKAVNSPQLVSFLMKPAGDWIPDDDFFAAVVPTLRIRQGDVVLPLESMSPFSQRDSSVVVGFSKSLQLEHPFEFMIGLGDEVFTTAYEVPPELWPAYPRLEALTVAASESRQSGAFRTAIAMLDSALLDPSLKEFPQLTGLRELRTATVAALANSAIARLDSAVSNPTTPLEQKVTAANRSAEELLFAADSLRAESLGIPVSESSMVSLAARIRSQAARSVIARDSLQQQFDLARIRWILEKGNHAKSSVLYAHMVEAIAYAFSSIDVIDTTQTAFALELPAALERRLIEEDTFDDYAIFVRMCNDRYRHGVPLFPVEFLPTLRRDTAQYAQPLYFMLQAVSDYWASRLSDAKAFSFDVLRRSSDSLIIARYDAMRMAVDLRQGPSAPEGLATLIAARERLRHADTLSAVAILNADQHARSIAPLILLRGDLVLRGGDTVAALGQYAGAWMADRRAVVAYLRSAEVLRARGEVQRASEILRMAIDAGNDYWIVFYSLGIASLEKKDPSAALLALNSALTIIPRSYETALALGRAYQMSGNYRRAREFYNRAIMFDPLRTEAVDCLTALSRMSRPPR